ncbi:MAG TPA: hypothetical protein PLL10_00240 [Elusimicrobiales bacterium]|nr:hypothetical protein [Elusimicrobiales bacterium]
MALIVKPAEIHNGDALDADLVQLWLTRIVNACNGQLTDANIKVGAAIAAAKIAGTAATLAGSETLENKTLTTPVVASVYQDAGKTLLVTLPAATCTLATEDIVPPVGSIIPFYDFSGALTFNAANWAYCNGQTKTIAGSSRTLPDLSNRYLVGFGTEGAGDNGSAGWDTAAVGAASHQINIAHTHSVPKHYHSRGTFAVSSSAGNNSANHTHSGTTASNLGAHNHSVTGGSHYHQITAYRGNGGGSSCIGSGVSSDPVTYDNTAADHGHTHSCGTTNLAHAHTITTGSQSANHNHTISNSYSGSIGCVAGSGGVDGDSDLTSASMLSATQSVQPRSVRVRYIMRIA